MTSPRWTMWRRVRYFLWCVWQAAGMAMTSRARLRAEAQQRMRAAPPLAKTIPMLPPVPDPEIEVETVICPFGMFRIEANPLNSAAAWLCVAGGFGRRPDFRGDA